MAEESRILLYAAILGLEIGFVYDIFRVFRRVWKCSFFIVACMDIGFWGFVTFRTFYMVHTWSNGTLRWFAILGVVTTFFIYLKLFSKLFVIAGVYIFSFVKRILDLIKKYLTKLLKLPIIKVGGFVRERRLHGRKSNVSDEIS